MGCTGSKATTSAVTEPVVKQQIQAQKPQSQPELSEQTQNVSTDQPPPPTNANPAFTATEALTDSQPHQQIIDNSHGQTHLDSFGHLVDENGGRVWSDAYYAARKEAQFHAEERGKCFEKSKAAFAENRKAEAKTLSDEGKQHGDLMNKANERAVFEILNPQNLDQATSIDLHGLLVQEAVDATKSFISSKLHMNKNIVNVTVITGQGIHSDKAKGAVIKPAIVKLLEDNKWNFEIDASNPGSINVHL